MMPASFRASATTAVAFPRRCAIRAHHSCSAFVLSVFYRNSDQAASTNQENEFLKTVVNTRSDVRFIYVLPFGDKQQLKWARRKYALEPFFDQGSSLSRNLELYQVPIKVYLEDGVIRKTWLDATVNDERRADFINWLSSL